MNILLTGGAGYIGTHTRVELLANDHSPVVVDNLDNSSEEALRRVEQITGSSVPFYTLTVEALKNERDRAARRGGVKQVRENGEGA